MADVESIKPNPLRPPRHLLHHRALTLPRPPLLPLPLSAAPAARFLVPPVVPCLAHPGQVADHRPIRQRGSRPTARSDQRSLQEMLRSRERDDRASRRSRSSAAASSQTIEGPSCGKMSPGFQPSRMKWGWERRLPCRRLPLPCLALPHGRNEERANRSAEAREGISGFIGATGLLYVSLPFPWRSFARTRFRVGSLPRGRRTVGRTDYI